MVTDKGCKSVLRQIRLKNNKWNEEETLLGRNKLQSVFRIKCYGLTKFFWSSKDVTRKDMLTEFLLQKTNLSEMKYKMIVA